MRFKLEGIPFTIEEIKMLKRKLIVYFMKIIKYFIIKKKKEKEKRIN